MSENPHHLESLLAGLQPAAPNPELQERVKADLRLDEAWLPRQMRRAPRWLAASSWTGLGAAAAVAVLALFPPAGGRSPVSAPATAHALDTPVDLIAPVMPAGLVWSWEKQEWVPADSAVRASLPEPDNRLLPTGF